MHRRPQLWPARTRRSASGAASETEQSEHWKEAAEVWKKDWAHFELANGRAVLAPGARSKKEASLYLYLISGSL